MQKFRKTVQLLVVITVLILTIRNILGYTKAHCESYCPSGGLEGIIFYVKNNAFLCATSGINLILLISVVISVVLIGRAFCSWICPVGAFVEFIYYIGKNSGMIIKNFWTSRLGRFLSYLRYIILAIILLASYKFADLVFRPFCIYYVLYSGQEHEIEWWSKWFMLFLIFIMFFIPYLWCRLICPLGTFLSLLKRLSLFYLRIKEDECNKCNVCSNVCLQQINLSQQQIIKDPDCTSCLVCVSKCPKKSIESKIILSKNSLNPIIVPLLVIILFSAGIIMAYNYPIPTITKKFEIYKYVSSLNKVDVIIKGMRCRGKANTVFWILEDLSGIAYLEAYAAESRLRVFYDPSKISEQQIIKRLKEGKVLKNLKNGSETMIKFDVEAIRKN